MAQITNDWAPVLKQEYAKSYYRKLYDFIHQEYATR